MGKDASGYTGCKVGSELMLSAVMLPCQILTFSAGVDNEAQDSVNSGLHRRTSSSVFLQDHISFFDNRIIFIPAARYDRYSDVGDSFNPKIGVCLKPNPFISLKANASKSFRVPGFDDLYWPRSGFAEGNSDLRPEKGRSYDAGIALNFDNIFRIEVAYFLNQVEELIQWQPVRGFVWSPTNVGKAEMQGCEATVRIRAFELLRVNFSHTYLDARDITDEDDVKKLIRRPRNRTTAQIAVGTDWLSGTIQATHTGKCFTTVANTRTLPAYTLVDCGVSASFKEFISLRLSVQNAFDKSYQMVPDYAMPGRSYSLTATMRFEGR